jgi:hypothetical protein
MAAPQASRYLARRTLLGSPSWARASSEVGRFASSRTIHYARSVPAITPSDNRRRPTLRPNHQPSGLSKVTGPSAGNKRTIFIQTESTPNPDVSVIQHQHPSPPSPPNLESSAFRFLTDVGRLSNSFQITVSFLKISPLLF